MTWHFAVHFVSSRPPVVPHSTPWRERRRMAREAPHPVEPARHGPGGDVEMCWGYLGMTWGYKEKMLGIS